MNIKQSHKNPLTYRVRANFKLHKMTKNRNSKVIIDNKEHKLNIFFN
jgi:hypothetical protein